MTGAGSRPEPHDRPARKDARAARKELVKLERQVGRLQEREAAVQEQLAVHATDYAKVAELDSELRAVRAERAAAEDAWLLLADENPDA